MLSLSRWGQGSLCELARVPQPNLSSGHLGKIPSAQLTCYMCVVHILNSVILVDSLAVLGTLDIPQTPVQ